ncbi:MAG: FAD-dependent oxidoreductase, partial [Planctomycetaceae bacterium]|nr:FAD-dependent oxidoreductase [Planctomycetaceae bacterium]
EERRLFQTDGLPRARPYAEMLNRVELPMLAAGQFGGIRMQPAGRLHVSRLLDDCREFFAARDCWRQGVIDPDVDIQADDEGVTVVINGAPRRARSVILCQGWQGALSALGNGVPDAPVRGDILRVRIPGLHLREVLHHDIWIVPAGNDEYLVGATFDRRHLVDEPSPLGAQELLTKLNRLVHLPIIPVDHLAGVRAGTRTRRAVAGRHPRHRCICVMNGLGSRGALLAPFAGQALLQMLENDSDTIAQPYWNVLDGVALPETDMGADDSRTADSSEARHGNPRGRSVTKLATNIVRRVVRSGETVVDATAGNGHDTLTLAELVRRRDDAPSDHANVIDPESTAARGHVLAFDVRMDALRQTRIRLSSSQLWDVDEVRIDLICDCHSRLSERLQQLSSPGIRIAAAMFNLGYLPGSDRTQLTQPRSTCSAIHGAIRHLRKDGVVTIVAYRGHAGGTEEAAAVETLIAGLDADVYQTDYIPGDPGNAASPVLFVIRRKD